MAIYVAVRCCDSDMHGLINYIDTKAKCVIPYPLLGFLFEVVSGQIQSVKLMQNWSPTEPDIRPPLHCIRTYSIHSHREGGGGGGVEPDRRGEGQRRRVQITKLD